MVFIAHNVGTSVLSQEEKTRLKSIGIDVEKLSQAGIVDDAFKFGILADALKYSEAKNITYGEFKTYLKSGQFVPLNQVEKFALENIKYQAYSDIKNLGARIEGVLTHMITEDRKMRRKEYEKIIKTKSKKAIKNRKSLSWLSSEIGHKTGDWSRDLDRVADFVLHTAFDEGKAQAIRRKSGDDAKVFKYVLPGACDACIDAYLTDGEGSEPVIFKLSQLISNGTNVGKKKAEWQPVIGPHHPWCRCELMYVREGFEWDEKTGDFTKPIKPKQRKVKSKVKVTISQ